MLRWSAGRRETTTERAKVEREGTEPDKRDRKGQKGTERDRTKKGTETSKRDEDGTDRVGRALPVIAKVGRHPLFDPVNVGGLLLPEAAALPVKLALVLGGQLLQLGLVALATPAAIVQWT